MKGSRLEEWSRFYGADQPVEIASQKPFISGSPSPHPLPSGERGRVRGRSFGFENWNLFGIWNLSFGSCGELSFHHALNEPFKQREPEESMEPRNLKDLS